MESRNPQCCFQIQSQRSCGPAGRQVQGSRLHPGSSLKAFMCHEIMVFPVLWEYSDFFCYLQKRRYGNYHGRRYLIGSVVIDPIYAVTFTIPYGFKQEMCNYTEEGRQLIHKRLTHLEVIFRYLAEHPLQHESVELNDNRISRMSAQGGKCAITKKQLTVYDMRVHKIYPKGGDGYRNIDIVRGMPMS